MKVTPLANNQYQVNHQGAEWLVSYESNIVYTNKNGKVFLDPKYYDYSRTTAKYRNQYLGMTSKQVQENIDLGIFKFKNLN